MDREKAEVVAASNGVSDDTVATGVAVRGSHSDDLVARRPIMLKVNAVLRGREHGSVIVDVLQRDFDDRSRIQTIWNIIKKYMIMMK